MLWRVRQFPLVVSACCAAAAVLPRATADSSPRYLATPVSGIELACGGAGAAPHFGRAIAADGRVLGDAYCNSVAYGSRPFVTPPGGAAVELQHGTFSYTQPAAFLGGTRYLAVADWCPPQTGTCTTALAIIEGSGAPVVLASSSTMSSVVEDANEYGWAVGWGGASSSGAFRVRPDGTLEALTVPGAWGLSAKAVHPSGTAVGNAYVSNQQRAVKWTADGSVSVLPSIESGTASAAHGIAIDGSVVGQCNGRAVWWFLPTGPSELLPVGSGSVATHLAGNPLAMGPLGISIFGTLQNGTRLFRATASGEWQQLSSALADPVLLAVEVIAAPRVDLMLAVGHDTMYQPATLVWTLADGLRDLGKMVVNRAASATPLVAVNANASGLILANVGFNGQPHIVRRLTDGDVDGDALVGGADLARTLSAWGAVPAGTRGEADFDGNGMVDGADLAIVLVNWN